MANSKIKKTQIILLEISFLIVEISEYAAINIKQIKQMDKYPYK